MNEYELNIHHMNKMNYFFFRVCFETNNKIALTN